MQQATAVPLTLVRSAAETHTTLLLRSAADQFCVLFMSFNVVVAVNAWATCMAALDMLSTCICAICFSFHQLHVTSRLAGSMLLLARRRHPAVVRLQYIYAADSFFMHQPLKPAC